MNDPKVDEMLKVASSKEAAIRLLNKEPGSLKDVLVSMGERTLLIGAGIAILGNRDNILRNSIAGSIAIEAYLLWYYSQQMKKE